MILCDVITALAVLRSTVSFIAGNVPEILVEAGGLITTGAIPTCTCSTIKKSIIKNENTRIHSFKHSATETHSIFISSHTLNL